MSTATPDTTDDSIALSVIAEQDLFADFLDRLEAIAVEAILQVDSDGIDVQVVDPANVGMIDADLSPAACESYDAGEFRVGVDIGRLQNAIGLADSGDDLIEVTYRDDAKFHVNGPDFEFTVAGIDPDSVRQPPEIPDLELPAQFDIEASKIKRALVGADMVTDCVLFRYDADADAVVLLGEGDVDDVSFAFDADDDLESVESRPAETTESVMSLKYLADIVDSLDADETVHIEVGDEFPMWMRQPVAEECDCLFMIAPRIRS